jgi:fatty-acyl-CoA synthase
MAPMDVELNLGLLLDHAVRHAAEVEIVTRTGDGSTRRYTYEAFGRRVNQLMHALDRIVLPAGTTVGTLAWNHDRHLEAYFAMPCSGRVIQTLNPRLGFDDLAHTVQQADDRVIFVDPDFVPLLDKIPDALVSRVHLHRGRGDGSCRMTRALPTFVLPFAGKPSPSTST